MWDSDSCVCVRESVSLSAYSDPEVPLSLVSPEQERRVWRRGQEPRAPRRPGRRGCILSPCMHPGPPGSTLIPRLQRPTALMQQPPPRAGGWGLQPHSRPSPIVLHDLHARTSRDRLECMSFGVLGAGLPRSHPPLLGPPWPDPFCGETGCPWSLRNATRLVGMARGRRQKQETKMAGGGLAYHNGRDLPLGPGRPGLAATGIWWRGGYPAHLGVVAPELLSTQTLVWGLGPLTGDRASVGEF